MADANQPPTETTSETIVIASGTFGSQGDIKVAPTRLGMYEIKSTAGPLPAALSGKYTNYALAKAAIKLYFNEEIKKTEALESMMDSKLKEQLKKRKEERSAKSTSR